MNGHIVPVTIAMVDDQLLFRQAMINLLHSTKRFRCLFQAANAAECLGILSKTSEHPDVLILDLELGEGINGIELNSILQLHYPSIRVLILSVHYKDKIIAKMIEAGVSGFLNKNCEITELTMALNNIHEKGYHVDQRVLQAIHIASLKRNRVDDHLSKSNVFLSNREKEVLQLICKEYSSAEISEKLFITPRTVEGHRNNLLDKTGCRNTAGLVLFAVKHSFVDVGL